MVSLPSGVGISVTDFLLIIEVLFVFAVLFTSFTATEGNVVDMLISEDNVFSTSWNVVDGVFLSGYNEENALMCANVFSSFNNAGEGKQTNAVVSDSNDGIVSDMLSGLGQFIGAIGEVTSAFIGFILNIFALIFGFLFTCGFGIIRFILGVGLILLNLFYIASLIVLIHNVAKALGMTDSQR